MFSFLGIVVGGFMALLLILLALAACVFWIWMLVSAIVNQGLTGVERLIWVVVIIFLHFLGAILYFFLGHPKRLSRAT